MPSPGLARGIVSPSPRRGSAGGRASSHPRQRRGSHSPARQRRGAPRRQGQGRTSSTVFAHAWVAGSGDGRRGPRPPDDADPGSSPFFGGRWPRPHLWNLARGPRPRRGSAGATLAAVVLVVGHVDCCCGGGWHSARQLSGSRPMMEPRRRSNLQTRTQKGVRALAGPGGAGTPPSIRSGC